MKKIINGRLYDTETAKCIAYYEYGRQGDFEGYSETMYRKKNGEFFMHGEGSCMSKYAVQVDSNTVSGSVAIIPMDEYEVKEWMEEYATAEEYIAVFGEPEE